MQKTEKYLWFCSSVLSVLFVKSCRFHTWDKPKEPYSVTWQSEVTAAGVRGWERKIISSLFVKGSDPDLTRMPFIINWTDLLLLLLLTTTTTTTFTTAVCLLNEELYNLHYFLWCSFSLIRFVQSGGWSLQITENYFGR